MLLLGGIGALTKALLLIRYKHLSLAIMRFPKDPSKSEDRYHNRGAQGFFKKEKTFEAKAV